MKWYENAVFYHIYPLGLTDAPKNNDYQITEHRLNQLGPWIKHIKQIGCNALYIGPLFESVGHGYETTDYYKLDSRLGDNEDLKKFVKECHHQGIHVIFDGVFNHTGRDFFAFKDIQHNRESSQYRDWYCNVNFQGNNEYNDGFSYDNWGGYNLLVKFNQQNPAVRKYLLDVVKYWVSEFDVDGIRLDAADVLDCGFMHVLRMLANEIKPEFWLMGEVIHGDYSRWVNSDMLHSVTNYQLYKALYSGHNEHNYFEIAHTVRYLLDKGNLPYHLYNFVDNHDVERIYTRLLNKHEFVPVHILMYTLPGIPSIYYGSEFGIEGRKEKHSDAVLRPAINLEDYPNALDENGCTNIIARLGEIRQKNSVFSDGIYQELRLTNRQYAFSRTNEITQAIVVVYNDEVDSSLDIPATGTYTELLSGEIQSVDGNLHVHLHACSGQIWMKDYDETVTRKREVKIPEIKQVAVKEETIKQVTVDYSKSYEEMSIEELQACVLEKLAKNGPVTEQMKRDVTNNVYHDSLINWVKSFRN